MIFQRGLASMTPKEYWDNKYPKQKIVYSGRSISKICPTCQQPAPMSGLNLDVRALITTNDFFLEDLIREQDLKGSNDDDTMIRIQRWIVKNIRYVGDDKNQGVLEHWQFPFETLTSRIGDCEDMAILLCTLGIVAGVPNYKLRVVAGWVKPDVNAELGGHGYCVYLRESGKTEEEKNQWVVLDGCYFPDPEVEIIDKPSVKANEKYKEVWFSFNNEFSWGNKDFNIDCKIPDFKPQ